MTEHLQAILRTQPALADEALAGLSDSDLCLLLCRLEQWHVAAQAEWDWRRHTRQEQAASAARRIE